jgi:hypothetical protein
MISIKSAISHVGILGALVLLLAALASFSSSSVAVAAPSLQSITPSSVVVTIPQGSKDVIKKEVQTPTIPPKVDIYFLSDTTGSMGGAIAAVAAAGAPIIATIDAVTPDAQYGAGDYKDFPFDAYAFNNGAPIPGVDDNGAAALAAIGAWAAGGGADGPEAQLYALHQLAAHGAAAFRPSATKVVVWFGDINGHDPVCTAISGDTHAVTLASLLPELTTAGIIVNAISVVGGPGLDGAFAGGDYAAACGPEPAPAGGQGSAITVATGGTSFVGVAPGAISAAILAGLSNLPVTVSMTTDCVAPISVSFVPPSVGPVVSGSSVQFFETISVAANAPPGVYECDDWALINGEPMTDAAGNIIKEHKKITVTDITPPSASCSPTTNPAGENEPAAPGKGGQGQNQDGFYILHGSDNVAVASILVLDSGSPFVSDPFADGDKVKITQAPGVTPSDNRPGPGVIVSHLRLKGDAILQVTDTSGNVTTAICLVPPKPQ